MGKDKDEHENKEKMDKEQAKLAARDSEAAKKSAQKAEDDVVKAEKKAIADAGKEEEKKKKELIATYDKRVADFVKSRYNRNSYWSAKDWNKREFWDRKNLEKLQKKLYKKQIQYMWKNSAYMHGRMEKEGITKTGMVKNLDDLMKLPFVSNADLAVSQREAPPYGQACCIKPGEIAEIGVTGETSAEPRYFFTGYRDLSASYRLLRPLLAAGVHKDDIAVLLGAEDFWALKPLCEVLRQDVGCLVICVASLDIKRRMEIITQMKATVLVGTPSQAQELADAALASGMDCHSTSVRLLITGGEAGIGSSREVGKSIEDAWNAKAYEFYGCQDVGLLAWSCDAARGLHLMEDDYLFEILDPSTREPVAYGLEGELVVTPLLNSTVPVTRYRTGDIVSAIVEPCPCRRTMKRIVIKGKLAAEPAAKRPEPPREVVVEPEPVIVAAGVTEVEPEIVEQGNKYVDDSNYDNPEPVEVKPVEENYQSGDEVNYDEPGQSKDMEEEL